MTITATLATVISNEPSSFDISATSYDTNSGFLSLHGMFPKKLCYKSLAKFING